MSTQEPFSERKEEFAPEISESETLWAADKRNKVCWADPWKERETQIIRNVTYRAEQQPNTSKP
jgi:hypothetical protein